MVQFCTAYKSVLIKHTLYATATTGRLVADSTSMPVTLLLSHKQGRSPADQRPHCLQREIDMVLLFTDPNTTDLRKMPSWWKTIRHCDRQNVPSSPPTWPPPKCSSWACSGAIWIGGRCTGTVPDTKHGPPASGGRFFYAERPSSQKRGKIYGTNQTPDPFRLHGAAARQTGQNGAHDGNSPHHLCPVWLRPPGHPRSSRMLRSFWPRAAARPKTDLPLHQGRQRPGPAL